MNHKLKNLDGVRGLAALIVIFGHYVNAFYPAITAPGAMVHSRFESIFNHSPLRIFIAASFSVSLFFVLSGFVLSVGFLQNHSVQSLTRHATRRYIRLMLPALASIIIAYIFLKLHLYRNVDTSLLTGSSGWLGRFWNFPADFGQALYEGFYGIFFTGTNSYNANLWTMQVELVGSFLVFSVLALFGQLQYRWIFYGILCLILLPSSGYLCFILGIILCDAYYSFPDLFKKIPTYFSIGLFVLSIWLGSLIATDTVPQLLSTLHIPGLPGEVLPELLHALGAVLFITSVIKLTWLTKFFESQPLQYLGKISFSLYLIHLSFIGTFSSYLFNHLLLDFSYNVSFLLMFVTSIILLLICSSLFNFVIDKPAILLSRRIGDFLNK